MYGINKNDPQKILKLSEGFVIPKRIDMCK